MQISEVRVKLVEKSRERLQAFCSITLDGDFVIRDLKIIDGSNGPFVAMPSRKLADRCPRCGYKNHLRARFCNECGARLRENRAPKDMQGRAKLHADVAHPINSECRERIQKALIEAYHAELERSKLPDYKPQAYDDDYEDDDMAFEASPPPAVEPESEMTNPRKFDNSFSDYNELVANLKKDAEGRRRHHDDQRRPARFVADASEDDDFEAALPSSPHREQPTETPIAPAVPPVPPDRERPASRPERPLADKSERFGGSRDTSSDSLRPTSSSKNEREEDDAFGAGLF